MPDSLLQKEKEVEEPTLLERVIAGEDISEPGPKDDKTPNKEDYDPADDL